MHFKIDTTIFDSMSLFGILLKCIIDSLNFGIQLNFVYICNTDKSKLICEKGGANFANRSHPVHRKTSFEKFLLTHTTDG